jgi:hypothetical protein
MPSKARTFSGIADTFRKKVQADYWHFVKIKKLQLFDSH